MKQITNIFGEPKRALKDGEEKDPDHNAAENSEKPSTLSLCFPFF